MEEARRPWEDEHDFYGLETRWLDKERVKETGFSNIQ